MSFMKILIIGAGPSGLVSAKTALAKGIEIEVFEKAETLGGVWRPDGLAWPGMHVNISRYSGVFSDFPWEDNKSDFPTTGDMHDYLFAYAKHFNLEPHIKFGRSVTSVAKKDTGWVVKSVENMQEYENYFDAVVVASGRFGMPQFPNIKGREEFAGESLHSADYRGQTFNGKTVLVVGGGTSGTAIAETVAETADKVIHLVRRPRWIMPRNVPTGENYQGPKIPHDLVKTRDRQSKMNIPLFYEYYTRLCKDQNAIPAWQMSNTDRFGMVIADNYINKVKQEKIFPVKDEIVQFDNTSVIFKSGKIEKIDTVIFCTGYQSTLSYFDKKIIDDLHLDMPYYTFYKHTIHLDYANLAFIAITYRDLGAVFPSAEFQAELACEYFLGRLQLSPTHILKEEIKKEPPISDGLKLQDVLAEKLNLLPHFDVIKYTDTDLYKQLWYGAAIPAQYRLAQSQGEQANKQAREIITKTDNYRQQLLTPVVQNVSIKTNYPNNGIFGQSDASNVIVPPQQKNQESFIAAYK